MATLDILVGTETKRDRKKVGDAGQEPSLVESDLAAGDKT